MRVILLSVVALLSTGCATVDTLTVKKYYYGYRHYDPCIQCGERWTQLPNWQHEAIIRQSRGEQW
jgi:uncharacterized protein YceK